MVPAASPRHFLQTLTPTACLNCGAALTGPFCSACGQKARAPDPTMREFLHETTEHLTNWDGKIPATLKALFLRPGVLTLDVLQGRRARWLPPLRVYLICSIVYFLSAPLMETITRRQARALVRFGLYATPGQELPPDIRAELDSSDVVRWVGRDRVERILKNEEAFNRTLNAAFPKAMLVLLPLFALLTNVAFRRKVPHYPAHLYFALHLHAAAFGALTLSKLTVLAGSITVDLVSALGALFYIGWYALRSALLVFGESVGATLARAAVVGVVYWVCFIAVTLALMAYTFATM